MYKLGILAGTTEGRLLLERLCNLPIEIVVSVATDYGAAILKDMPNISLIVGRKDYCQMRIWLKKENFDGVIDATHPFAQVVTQNLQTACEETHTPYWRLLREEAVQETSSLIFCQTLEEVIAYLQSKEGNILLTIGSKDLMCFKTLAHYQQRLFVRILPMQASLASCEAFGLAGSHIIAMQGPFSEEMNRALLRHTEAKYLVTKSSGAGSGYEEKIAAAQALGVEIIVLKRPQEQGWSLMEMEAHIKAQLEAYNG